MFFRCVGPLFDEISAKLILRLSMENRFAAAVLLLYRM
jgi:hypothetical protein